MSNNSIPMIEPVVMTFRLSPDVMDQAIPHIQFLSALQGHLSPSPTEPVGVYTGPDRRRRRPAASDAPAYGEERIPKDEARTVLPKDHEGVTVEPSAKRGRIPGLYKLVDNTEVDPEQLTPSALAIYRVMQARVQKAATAVDIANRLRMSNGTVGWALAELRKVGLVEYVRPSTPTTRKPKPS